MIEGSRRRRLLIGGLHLTALWALGFVQPLFNLLSDNAEFFVARGNKSIDIVVYAIGYTLLPPLAMVGIEAIAIRIREGLYRGIHLTLIGLLTAAIALQLIEQIVSRPAGLMVLAALAIGALGAVAYQRTRFVPQALTVLSVAPLVFVALFLVTSPVSKLVFPQQAASAHTTVAARTPVILIVVDELPVITLMDAQHRIDPALFPNFAALARQSTWYENATAVADKTPRAIPAILTGTNPGYERLPISSEQPNNLFTLLGRNYRIHDFETATELCPAKLCSGPKVPGGNEAPAIPPFRTRMHSLISDLRVVSERLLLPDALDDDLPPVNQTFGSFAGSEADSDGDVTNRHAPGQKQLELGRQLRAETSGSHTELFLNLINSITPHLRSLYYIYFQVPHFPWQHWPDGRRYTPIGQELNSFLDSRGRWLADPWLIGHAYQRYLMQSAYADTLLGKMITRLKEKGVWEKSLVVVTADHGTAFDPGVSRRDANLKNLAEIGSLPLFVKAPGQQTGKIVGRQVKQTDILPTMAELLGIKLPFPTQGSSALHGGGEDEVRLDATSGQTISVPLQTLIRDRNRAIARKVSLFGSDLPASHLFLFGPHHELIGRSVSALRTEPASGGHIALDHSSDFATVDTNRALLPGIVEGALKGVAAGEPIAVAVNGRIATVARSIDINGGPHLVSLVPPSALRAGANSVEVFLVAGSGRKLVLQPLGGTAGG